MVNNGLHCHPTNSPLSNSNLVKKSSLNYEDFLSLSSQAKKYIRKSTAGYVLATTSYGLSNDDEILKNSGFNLKKCNSKPNFFADINNVLVKEVSEFDTVTKHLSNVLHCGSPWVCPVCSAKISTVKSLELSTLMEVGRLNNRFYSLVVLTIPHRANQSLEELNFILSTLRKKLQEHKLFRAFKKEYSLRFLHVGLELMLSIKDNLPDFHPHINFIFDFDTNPNLSEFELSSKIYEIVSKILEPNKKLDLIKSSGELIRFEFIKRRDNLTLKAPYTQKSKRVIKFADGGSTIKDSIQVKGGVTATYDFKEDYATKFGLAQEVTMGLHKGSDITKSFHPFQALDFIRFLELEIETKKLLIEMFRSYVKVFKGKTLFTFGQNSIKYYNDNYSLDKKLQEKTEQQIVQESESVGDIILEVPISDWIKFNPTALQVLALLTKESPKDMMDYIYAQIEKDDFKEEKELLQDSYTKACTKTKQQQINSMKKTINEVKNNPNRQFREDFINLFKWFEKDKNLNLLNSPSRITYLNKDGEVIKPTALSNPNSISIPYLSTNDLFNYIKDLRFHLTNPFLDDLELSIIKDKLYYANKVLDERFSKVDNRFDYLLDTC